MAEVVVVSGAPGAGKSTLARPLATGLGFPLLSKDVIKETLFDHLGHVDADEQVSSQRLGAAAMELLWQLAGDCPAVVIEANFRSASAYERGRLASLTSTPVEVYCRVPVEVARERFEQRAGSAGHHAVHVARSLPDEVWGEFREPFGLGLVIEVDTTRAVDLDALLGQIRAALQG